MDFPREALPVLVHGIMDAEVSAQIRAQHGERNPDHLTRRKGDRGRAWDTRVGRWNGAFQPARGSVIASVATPPIPPPLQ